MIIDFHTHTFPEAIAHKAIEKLSSSERLSPFTDGTNNNLLQSSYEAGVDLNILLPVVTKPSQTPSINQLAVSYNKSNDRLYSFGGIHPDNDNYKEILDYLADNGIKGIKLHPVFQNTYIDDIKYLRIVDYACENDMVVLFHTGLDISEPDSPYSSVSHTLSMLKSISYEKIVLAHMGGWACWTEALEMLSTHPNVYVDTAFCLPSPVPTHNNPTASYLDEKTFLEIVKVVGYNHVLFGTDSPWTEQKASIEAIRSLPLTKKEISCILGENAKNLLKI